jgi:hypothetical protein
MTMNFLRFGDTPFCETQSKSSVEVYRVEICTHPPDSLTNRYVHN